MTAFTFPRWPRVLVAVGATVSLALAITSCGSNADRKPLAPVQGKVFYKKKPAEKALVILHPVGETDPEKNWPDGFPRGVVAADGSFKITTYKSDDGAPPGKYVVLIQWPLANPKDEEDDTDRLQGRYSDPAKSKFQVEIKQGPNEIGPFELN